MRLTILPLLMLLPSGLMGSSQLSLSKSISPATVQPGDTVTVCISVQSTGSSLADIYWVFDTTGSMSSSIDNLKNNIGSFTSQLASQGINYQNGLMEYKDLTDPVPFTNYGFASSDSQFLGWVSGLTADGGGDWAENGLEAITQSAAVAWRAGASRTMVLITDAPVHEVMYAPPGTLSLTATAQALKALGITIYVISSPDIVSWGGNPGSDPQRLTDTAGGEWYDLYSASWSGLLAGLGANVAGYSNLLIQDPMPPQLTPIAGTLGGATLTGSTLSWSVSYLGVGDTFTRCFLSLAAPGFTGAITNTACVSADGVSATCGSAAPIYYVTPTPTYSPSPTASPSFTITQSFTSSPTFSYSPTITPSFTITQTFTHTPTASPSPTCSATPTASATPSPTPKPLTLQLLPPNPNPSPGRGIWLPFYISTDADVDIRVYTVAGEVVRALMPQWTRAGYAERFWDLKNDAGNDVSSGTYIYRIQARNAQAETQSDFSKCAVRR